MKKNIKVSNAQTQIQQAIPTLSDSESAELELHLFGYIDPVATGSVSSTVMLDRPSITLPVKSTHRRKIISANPLRSPSGTQKKRSKNNKPAAKKRIRRK